MLHAIDRPEGPHKYHCGISGVPIHTYFRWKLGIPSTMRQYDELFDATATPERVTG